MRTAKDLNIKIDDADKEIVCENCELAKARRKNLGKITSAPARRACERLYVDTSWIEQSSIGGAKFWILVVDEWTKFCWSFFKKLKSDLAETVLGLINELKDKGLTVGASKM